LDDARADALLERLPYARRLELGRRDASARHASLLALDLVLTGIARLRGGVVQPGQLRFPQDGKPHLEGGPSFSLSHTRTRVAVALGEGCEVGVDVEDASQPSGGQRTREELERWTATEAALKAVGAGLRSAAQLQLAPDLASAELAGVRIRLARLDLGPGWVASLATLGPAGSVIVAEVVPT
jgi:phosphopantetheinyl transferase